MLKALLALFVFTGCHPALAQTRTERIDILESHGAPKNYIRNPSATRTATIGVVQSSAVIGRSVALADRIDGVASFTCDTSALNGFCEWLTETIKKPDDVGNCEASISFKGDGSLKSLVVSDGTNTLASSPLWNASDWTTVRLNYPCGTTRSVRVVQTTAGTTPALNVGRVYYGRATNIGSSSQATFVGGMEQAGSLGCDYLETSSSGTSNFVALGVGTGCIPWTVQSNGPGIISAQGTNDHRLVYTNMPPGNYRIFLSGLFVRNAVGGCFFRMTDGTNNFQVQGNTGAASTQGSNLLQFDVTYTSSATRTFTLQASDDHASACGIANGNSASNVSWKIYRYPTAQEQNFRPELVAWRVDANISGANPSLGTANVATYTGITNASLTLTNNSGVGVIPAQIACAGTTAPSGNTCTAADEGIAISWLQPTAGDVLACVNITHAAAAPSGSNITSAFQIVETPNNAQTILQEGKGKILNGSGTLGSNSSRGMRVCGTFTFASAGQKTLRLMYEQEVSGTPTGSDILADAAASQGQRDIKWEVYPLNYQVPAPLLVGSVTSANSGMLRIESATVVIGAATCSISSQTSPWLNVTFSAGPFCTGTMPAGTFSSKPFCLASAENSTYLGAATATSATNFSGISARLSTSGALQQDSVNVTCIGPR